MLSPPLTLCVYVYLGKFSTILLCNERISSHTHTPTCPLLSLSLFFLYIVCTEFYSYCIQCAWWCLPICCCCCWIFFYKTLQHWRIKNKILKKSNERTSYASHSFLLFRSLVSEFCSLDHQRERQHQIKNHFSTISQVRWIKFIHAANTKFDIQSFCLLACLRAVE